MKILHFIYDSIDNPWLGGGGAFRTHAIYEHFNDCDLTVYSANYIDAKSNIKHQQFIGPASKGYIISRLNYAKSARNFIKNNHQNYDLIIEDFSPFSPLFLTKLVPQNKVLLILQNYFGLKNHIRKFGPIGYLTNFFEKKSIQLHDNILFSSEDLKNQVHANIKDKFTFENTIHYGVDDELFIPDTPNKEKYFSFFGRLEIHQKGLDLLLEAFAEIVKKYPEFRLKIAGKGKDEVHFRQMITDKQLNSKIDFVGFIRGESKIQFLSNAYALLMPSTFESWGISSLESQACRTPVVGSNIPGLRQTVQHEKSGFLYNSKEDFINYIEQLILLNKDEYLEMCHQSHQNAKKFRWKPSAERQQDYYQQIIKKSI